MPPRRPYHETILDLMDDIETTNDAFRLAHFFKSTVLTQGFEAATNHWAKVAKRFGKNQNWLGVIEDIREQREVGRRKRVEQDHRLGLRLSEIIDAPGLELSRAEREALRQYTESFPDLPPLIELASKPKKELMGKPNSLAVTALTQVLAHVGLEFDMDI